MQNDKEIALSLRGIERILEAKSLESLLLALHPEIEREFGPRRVLLFVKNSLSQFLIDPVEWHLDELQPTPAKPFLRLCRLTEENTSDPANSAHLEELILEIGHSRLLRSLATLPDGELLKAFIFDPQQGDTETLEQLLRAAIRIYSPSKSHINVSNLNSERYVRLVEHSDAILFNTDPDHHVRFISRRALDFFGMAPEEFVSGNGVNWVDLILPEDATNIRTILRRQLNRPEAIDEEVRVINRVTGRVRWVLIRLVPVLSRNGDLEGWDGFGIDVSARREAQEALDNQSRKIRALYTVSSAIRGYLDPANISMRGLAALCDATGASSGICFLYPPKTGNPASDEFWGDIITKPAELQQIARYGFDQEISEKDPVLMGIAAFAGYVAQSGQSLVVPDLCSDPRSGPPLATQDKLRSAIFVPIVAEDEVLGAVGLFGKETASFDGSSVMLVGAAANQVGLAARQANLFSLYRRQTRNLSALYRMSHELSQHLEFESLFKNAFSIMRDELGLKRLWLGILDESGTKLIGQAAYGPGWRRRLIDVVVDVTSDEYVLGRVVHSRKPVVIARSEELMREFGVQRIFSQMSIHAVAIMPVFASGELIGVLAVQPGVSEPEFQPEQLHLLLSLASEIGVSVQTIKLAAQTREGEKMRTSSVLAAGIAHNFNNSLQAILGQASLLEMQSASPQRVEKAAKAITEAATKSAVLVRQLLAFTQFEEPRRDVVDVKDFLLRNREAFARILTSKNILTLDVSADIKSAYLDSSQLVRVFNAILQNAFEAMPSGGKVTVQADSVEFGDERGVSEIPPGRYVRIRIRDTGMGMTEEVRRRCFEPFFTTKNVDPTSGLGFSGSGLGLAAAYTLVKRNSGRILVESQLGNGTTVTLYLPEAKEALLDRGSDSSLEHPGKIERLKTVVKNDKEKGVPQPQNPDKPDDKRDIGIPQGNA